MVWATPSIFEHSVYPSDVIIRPINALKAFSSLDNELLSKQPCRAISACRFIWSHKGLMPWGGGVHESVGAAPQSFHTFSELGTGSVFRTPKMLNALLLFCSVCRFLSLPQSQVELRPIPPARDLGCSRPWSSHLRHLGQPAPLEKMSKGRSFAWKASPWPFLKALTSKMVFELQETPFILQSSSFLGIFNLLAVWP